MWDQQVKPPQTMKYYVADYPAVNLTWSIQAHDVTWQEGSQESISNSGSQISEDPRSVGPLPSNWRVLK